MIDRLRQFFTKKSENNAPALEQMTPNTFSFNARKFASYEVKDVMIPKTDIIASALDTPIKELKQLFYTEEVSRIPMYRDSIDEMEGFIHVKDLFKVIARTDKVDMESLLRDLLFVPESLKVTDLLGKMQREKIHIAIVLDEYGATSGLITIEDIVELIVGDIDDEHDISEGEPYTKVSSNTYIFDAKCSLEEFTEITSKVIEVTEDDEFDTLGGFVSAKLGYIPKAGEKLESDSIIFEIITAKPRCIERIKVTLL